MEHIPLRLGNILFIGAIAVGAGLTGVILVNHFSNKDVPLVSPTARGLVDLIHGKAAA